MHTSLTKCQSGTVLRYLFLSMFIATDHVVAITVLNTVDTDLCYTLKMLKIIALVTGYSPDLGSRPTCVCNA